MANVQSLWDKPGCINSYFMVTQIKQIWLHINTCIFQCQKLNMMLKVSLFHAGSSGLNTIDYISIALNHDCQIFESISFQESKMCLWTHKLIVRGVNLSSVVEICWKPDPKYFREEGGWACIKQWILHDTRYTTAACNLAHFQLNLWYFS